MTERFKIGEAVYDMATLDELNLQQILGFERETEALGKRMTWGEFMAQTREVQELTGTAREDHPATPWMLAVTMWASRTLAGERVTLAEASDFSLSQLSYLTDPQDHKGKAAGPRKARAAKASARAVKRPAARPV